jgi:hypothetical protein
MFLIDRIKDRLHRDIIRDPRTHGWVLNLYLNGERYPQTVSDYFPSEYAPNEELAQSLRRHGADEHKHELLFIKALRSLGQPVVELARVDVFNEVIRSCTPARHRYFHIAETDDLDARREKLAHFLAHAHFLEQRIAKSLHYHVDSCESQGAVSVARQVGAVLRDEERHVSYTVEAVFDLLPRRRAVQVVALHREAEAKANLMFSSTQLRHFAERLAGALVPRTRRVFYRFCAAMMEGASRYA